MIDVLSPDQRPKFYLIWSVEHQGWWKPRRAGYTQEIKEAGHYAWAEAVAICHDANQYVIDDQGFPNEAMVPIIGQRA